MYDFESLNRESKLMRSYMEKLHRPKFNFSDWLCEKVFPLFLYCMLFIAILGFVGAICAGVHESTGDYHSQYYSWSAAVGKTNLTYEQWNELRQEELLPGQPKTEYVPMVT